MRLQRRFLPRPAFAPFIVILESRFTLGTDMSDDSPRLYLILPPDTAPGAVAGLLKPALKAGDIACLLAPAGGAGDAEAVLAACRQACAAGDTAVLSGDPALAKTSGCDGAHVSLRSGEPETILPAAVKHLKPRFILGVGGLRSRHAAMAAGELDIDYLMFGEPAPDGFVPPLEQTLERTQWWSEIFNVPCVAYAARLEDVAPLAQAGADFIALREAVWADPRGAAAAIADAMKAIAAAGAAA